MTAMQSTIRDFEAGLADAHCALNILASSGRTRDQLEIACLELIQAAEDCFDALGATAAPPLRLAA